MANTNQYQMYHVEVGKKTGASPNTSEAEWVIPAGEVLRLMRFSGGHEASTQEVRVELLYRTAGGDTVVAVGYSEAFQFLIDRDFEGNGANSIVIKHINGDSSTLNMAGWWEGVTHG